MLCKFHAIAWLECPTNYYDGTYSIDTMAQQKYFQTRRTSNDFRFFEYYTNTYQSGLFSEHDNNYASSQIKLCTQNRYFTSV